MKGYTKIELTDVKTGKTQVVEHKNMVTNAMSELSKPFQFFTAPLGSKWFPETTRFANSAFGGIFLFESELSTDSDDFLIPDGNKVVGSGCELANNTTNTLMGTYNTSESGIQDDGSYKHVWDFSTDQGNGEISAVALTPRYTAQAGWGIGQPLYASSLNFDSTVAKTSNNQYIRVDASDGYLCIIDGYLYRIPVENLCYVSASADKHITRNGGKLVIEKLRVADAVFGIHNCPQSVFHVDDTLEFELPDEFMNSFSNTATSFYSHIQYDNGYVYVGCDTTWTVSDKGSFKLAKIKLSDGSVEVLTITNSTGGMMYKQPGRSGQLQTGNISPFIVGNKMYINSAGANGKPYVLDLDTMTYYPVKNYGTDDVATYAGKVYGKFGNNLLCVVYAGSNYIPYVVNIVDCTLRRINVSTAYVFEGFCCGLGDYPDFVPIEGDKVRTCGGQGNIYFGFNPFILTTKNNLDTPVTKTSDQTMKITYILTESETS